MAGTRASALLALIGAAFLADLALVLAVERRPGLVVLAAGVAAVVAVALARPPVVLVAASFLVVSSSELLSFVDFPRLHFAGLELELTDLLLGAILLAWWAREPRLARPGAETAALLAREPALWAFVPLAGLAAIDLGRGGPGVLSSARIFGYCFVVLVATRLLDGLRAVRLLGFALVAGGVASSLVGAWAVAAGRSITPSNLSTGGVRGVSIGGSYLVAAALLWVLASVVAGARAPSWSSAAAVVVLAGGVGISGSRETWVGLAGALAVFAVWSPFRGVTRLVATFGLAAALAGGAFTLLPSRDVSTTLQAVETRLRSVSPETATRDPSVEVRFDKWRVVWDQVHAHPVFGTGFGYPASYTSNIGGDNFVRSYVDDPENTHLWLWARMGTVGFGLWVAFNLLVAGTLLARFLRVRSPELRALALWGAGTLVVVWSGMAFSPVSAFASALALYWCAVAAAPVVAALAERDER